MGTEVPMKRRDFLRAVGISAATTVAIGIIDDDKLDAAIGMDDDVDPVLEEFVTLLNNLMDWSDRPGWIVVPEKTYRALETEMVPECRFTETELAKFGHENLLIKGIPVIPIRTRRTL